MNLPGCMSCLLKHSNMDVAHGHASHVTSHMHMGYWLRRLNMKSILQFIKL